MPRRALRMRARFLPLTNCQAKSSALQASGSGSPVAKTFFGERFIAAKATVQLPSSSDEPTPWKIHKKKARTMSSLLQHVLAKVRSAGVAASVGKNIVAYSGGVDSSVVAAAVHREFPSNTLACIGVSASMPQQQLELARKVASHVGVPWLEVPTTEGSDETYIKNQGQSCYVCKTHLYSTLRAIVQTARDTAAASQSTVVLFNGTNKDDTQDTTRVGLKAAEEFKVVSPLSDLTKAEVREVARELGLPNHAHAASPCLRSRLAFGVPATADALYRIEEAELVVRELLQPQVHHNLRVRQLKDGAATVEVDSELLERTSAAPIINQIVDSLVALGFTSVLFRPYRQGSVAAKGGFVAEHHSS